jgi:prolyl oligopeptidase
VQVGPAQETGDAPVHFTGYGGFALPSLPYYNSAVGKLWLERGGTSVVADIRGGGEFGTPWHDAGRRAGKRLSHDDFAAVAADFVNRGITRASREFLSNHPRQKAAHRMRLPAGRLHDGRNGRTIRYGCE